MFSQFAIAFGFISFRSISFFVFFFFCSFVFFFFFSLLQFEHTLKNVSCRGLLSYYFRRRRRRRRWRWLHGFAVIRGVSVSHVQSTALILHSTPSLPLLLLFLLGLFATFISFCCNIAQLQLGIEIGPINAAFV